MDLRKYKDLQPTTPKPPLTPAQEEREKWKVAVADVTNDLGGRYAMWAGRLKALPERTIRQHLAVSRQQGKDPIRLFQFLIKLELQKGRTGK